MTTTSQTSVSQDLIDRCERTIGPDGKVFYVVASLSVTDQHYKVHWNAQHGRLQCSPFDGEPCKASKEGWTCWHMRAALAAEAEYKAFKKAERAAEQRIAEATAQYQREQVEQACAEAHRRLAELDARENGSSEASKREKAAVRRYGAKAYESAPFSLYR